MTTEMIAQISPVIGMGAFYFLVEVGKWLKSRKSNTATKSAVSEILDNSRSLNERFSADLSSVKTDIREIKKELTYNGGSSLKDQLNEMKGLHEARFYSSQNQHPEPIFHCDKSGNCTFSNKALADLFGMHYTEMLGKGWLKAVGTTQLERETVYEEWITSVRNEIPFEREYTVVNQRTKEKFQALAKAEAQRKSGGEVVFYSGTVTRI